MTQQQYQYQYYSFLEESRKRALVNQLLAQSAVQIIRRSISIGIDPREDPDLNKYWKLISEDDKQMFISEIERLHLVIEDEDDSTNSVS